MSHLHPFVQPIELAATDKHPSRTVRLIVSFGLHTFTRSIDPHDQEHDLYRDSREVRAFCRRRHERSLELPGIIRSLESRRCEFARTRHGLINYVTVQLTNGERYAAFFDLRKHRNAGPEAVRLLVQSAYVLEPSKPTPGKGRIHLHALIGHALRGTTPKPPPR